MPLSLSSTIGFKIRYCVVNERIAMAKSFSELAMQFIICKPVDGWFRGC